MIVISMQLAVILSEVLHARAMQDTQAMERFVKVWSSSMHNRISKSRKLVEIFCSTVTLICVLDINECALNIHNCDANAICNNLNGSFNCLCNIGYTENGTICQGNLTHAIRNELQINVVFYES